MIEMVLGKTIKFFCNNFKYSWVDIGGILYAINVNTLKWITYKNNTTGIGRLLGPKSQEELLPVNIEGTIYNQFKLSPNICNKITVDQVPEKILEPLFWNIIAIWCSPTWGVRFGDKKVLKRI